MSAWLTGSQEPRSNGAGVPADLSRWMRDLVVKNQVMLGTVNASRTAFEGAVHRLEQFMVLFPQAVCC